MRIIAGRWRGHSISAPRSDHTRPTTDRVREAWMSMLHPELPDATVLDLYAGSGSLGLEALSRGARHATFVERGRAALRALRGNIDKLGAEESATVVRRDALAFVAEADTLGYDIALADPPYDSGAAMALVERFLRDPFARILWVEHRVSDPLPDAEETESRRYGDTLLTRYLAP